MTKHTRHIVLIADQDEVVAVAGASKKSFYERRITEHVEEVMRNSASHSCPTMSPTRIRQYEDLELSSQVIAPIIVEGDIAGAVIMLSQEGKSMGELELKLAETAAGFLAKQLGQ
jgi:AbrB family transcriptional regulator (stage V sporulation protein T)